MGTVTLRSITPDNWQMAAEVEHAPEQRAFVASGAEILALADAARHNNARALAIYAGEALVGLLLVEDLNEEPACYHLHEVLIDAAFQRKGYGTQALELLLTQLEAEGRFPMVEVCVHARNTAAIAFYEANGFSMTNYTDAACPWNRSMVYIFERVDR